MMKTLQFPVRWLVHACLYRRKRKFFFESLFRNLHLFHLFLKLVIRIDIQEGVIS